MLALLQRRRGLLDGVVFSGGEPTLQKDLVKAIQAVRAQGFKVGLHTGGMYPNRLAGLLPFIDWVGLDVKAPFADYEQVTGAVGSGGRVLASLQLILESGVAHEIRTTVHPVLLSDAEVGHMARDLAERGVRHYAIQAFRSQGCANDALCRQTVRERSLQDVGAELAGLFERLAVRA